MIFRPIDSPSLSCCYFIKECFSHALLFVSLSGASLLIQIPRDREQSRQIYTFFADRTVSIPILTYFLVVTPATCCNPTSDTCAINDVSYRGQLCEVYFKPKRVNTHTFYQEQLKKAGAILGGVAAGVLVLEIFGIVAAVRLRKKSDRYA